MGRCVSFKNFSKVAIQVKVQRIDSLKNLIILEEEVETDLFYFASFSSPEGEESRMKIKNLSENLRIETFIGDDEKTSKKRAIYPGRSKYLKLAGNEIGLIVPVLIQERRIK